jgi:hypothetical protein
MNGFTQTDNLVILIFGLFSGGIGYYLTWLETVGRYEEMGLLFPFWLILQIPVFLIAINFPDFFLLLTFVWWFLLGNLLSFVIIFFKDYFKSLHVE